MFILNTEQLGVLRISVLLCYSVYCLDIDRHLDALRRRPAASGARDEHLFETDAINLY